jgi:hypothetical protein
VSRNPDHLPKDRPVRGEIAPPAYLFALEMVVADDVVGPQSRRDDEDTARVDRARDTAGDRQPGLMSIAVPGHVAVRPAYCGATSPGLPRASS